MLSIKTCPETSLKTCSENCSITCPEACLKTCTETYSTSSSESFSEICPKPCSFTLLETDEKTCPETFSESCNKSSSFSCPETCEKTCSEIVSKPCSFTFPKTCSETCLNTCSDSCAKPCSFTCSETCLNTCSDSCAKPCSFTCPETSLKTCSETRFITCPETCADSSPKSSFFTFPETCLNTCSETCSEPCSFTFPETCLNTCSETCSETYAKPCTFTFPKSCTETCLNTCSETCSEICPKSCSFTFPKSSVKTFSETCSTTCSETCSEPCSFTCPETCNKTYLETCTISNSEKFSESCSKPRSSFNAFSNTCSMTSKSITIPRHCGTGTPKAYSVYSCGFGGRTRISSCSYRLNSCSPSYKTDSGYSRHGLFGGGHCTRVVGGGCYGTDYYYLQKTEKATMQNLNDRLASYLDKVHFLEAANVTLERQIREYYEKKGSICQSDHSCYLKTIDCLQKKIKDATIINGEILMRIDNSKLAADDYRIKYENELLIGQCVKADIDNLRYILDKTCMAKDDLDVHICVLEEDLMCLKKSHQEDVAALMCRLTNAKVCVEVDAAPQQDLTKVLDDIRCHYETIIDKHCREQEFWFKEKMVDVRKDAATNTECLKKTYMSQVFELRRTLQNLEIELQTQISMKGALKGSLLETEARYNDMLAGFQKHINMYEAELCQVRAGIEQQGKDYAALLDIKSRLEQEIATYRCLLENQNVKS